MQPPQRPTPAADYLAAEPRAEPIRVVVMHHQELFRRGLALVLSGDPGVALVGEAADGDTGLNLVSRWAPDVVLVGARMPGMPDICDGVRAAAPAAGIVLL